MCSRPVGKTVEIFDVTHGLPNGFDAEGTKGEEYGDVWTVVHGGVVDRGVSGIHRQCWPADRYPAYLQRACLH